MLFRCGFCMAWARILLLFGRFGRGVVQWLCIFVDSKGNVRHFFGVLFAWRGFEFCCCSSVSEAFRERLLCTSLMDSKGNVKHFFGVLFAWRGFESCCCSSVSAALRQRLSKLETLALVGVPREAALNCFVSSLMDSKGNVRHFFGVRFAWHGLESCCCSGVSEPASKGLAPMVSELRSQLGCRTKALVFMGSKGNGKHFVEPGFAWHGLSILSDLRLQGTCANGFGTSLALRVPDKRTVFYGFQRWREAFCRAAFCLAWARILLLFGCCGTGLQRTCSKATRVFPRKAICRDDVGATSDLAISAREICFLWIPKVTWSSFSVCVLLGMGSNPAAVRAFRNRPPKDLRQWFRNYVRS